MNARTTALVAALSAAGEDFEFYPTTEEIIRALVADIKRSGDSHTSILDIGAGTGKVLCALRDRCGFVDLHAIEKSMLLCENMPPEILIVGTDFAAQSLLSKNVDVIFCNPPYSAFEAWAVKIIREASARVIYLVIPDRWENSPAIKDALKYREAEARAVGQFDFESAEDRSARAHVSLLCVSLGFDRHSKHDDDAFERFFREQFADMIGKFNAEAPRNEEEGNQRRFSQIVVGPNYIESLVSLYDAEMRKVQNNFNLVSQLDVDLLREFNINPKVIMECLKTRLSGLRGAYWAELLARLDTVTNRLTSKSRRNLLDVLQRHVQVDFTASNIYAVMLWVIKNANIYIDSQLLSVYDEMVDKCNVRLYKSNKRTWEDNRWRYNSTASENTHYALDYRVVTHRVGGVKSGEYSFDQGLEDSAALFLGDLLTIARNLGFDCETAHHHLYHSSTRAWAAGVRYEFGCVDKKGKRAILYDVRAFKNRNLHIRFNRDFILALNVEHGRLKGWLQSKADAVDELGDPAAAQYFDTNRRLTVSNFPMLAAPVEEGPTPTTPLFDQGALAFDEETT